MDSSVVLVALRRFATVERILSYELPHFMIRGAFLTELDRFKFSFTSSFLSFSCPECVNEPPLMRSCR